MSCKYMLLAFDKYKVAVVPIASCEQVLYRTTLSMLCPIKETELLVHVVIWLPSPVKDPMLYSPSGKNMMNRSL